MWRLRIIGSILIALSLLTSCGGKEQPQQQEKTPPRAGSYEFEPYDGELPSAYSEDYVKETSLRPLFLLEWQYEDIKSDSLNGKLRLYLDFENEANSFPGLKGVSPQGVLYCVITYPDGVKKAFSAEIEAGAMTSIIDVPIPEPISWRLNSPALYRFRLLFKAAEGVYEYNTVFGFNRSTSAGRYFNFEGQSIFLRGAFDPGAEHLTKGEVRAFLKQLKGMGFNLYITDTILSSDVFSLAAEEGIMIACISDRQSMRALSEEKNQLHNFAVSQKQLPSWIGSCIDRRVSLDKILFSDKWIPDEHLFFNTGSGRGNWLAIPVPTCVKGYEEAILSLGSGLMSGPDAFNDPSRRFPQCIAYFGIHSSDCISAEPDMYELINLFRRQEWCAGFIIPLDLYTDDFRGLMTDDFLIFDYEGFPLEKPLVVKAGSTFHLPLRYANLKPEGDLGGVIYWLWEETGEEGRIEYPQPDKKGILDFPALDIPVPDFPGKYRLHFEVVGWTYVANAINWLDVVVE